MIHPAPGAPWRHPNVSADMIERARSAPAPDPALHAATVRSLRGIAGAHAVGEYLMTLESLHGADYASRVHELSA